MNPVIFVSPKELVGIPKTDFILPKRLHENENIIAVKKENQIQSFIYFSVYNDYIQINYSFTGSPFRRQGLSSILRNYLVSYARENKKQRIVSVPFENANSVSLLKKTGFQKCHNNDSYVLSL